MADSPDVRWERAVMYAPIDHDTASILSEYIDDIISAKLDDRSALCSAAVVNEWFEAEVLTAGDSGEIAYVRPLRLRITVNRTHERGEQAYGELYNMAMEWSTLKGGLVNSGYMQHYALILPNDSEQEGPLLLVGQQQLDLLEGVSDAQIAQGAAGSNFPEANLLLKNNSFYDDMSLGTQYDAEQLFEELSLLWGALHAIHRGSD